MMKKGFGQKIDTVFVLIIFCVFAISVLMVLMLGANIYQNVTETTQEDSAERLALSFIWTKLKNDDVAGNMSVGRFHSCPALFFDEEFDRTIYRTVIYHYDGWVYELFSEKDLDFLPEDGTKLVEISDLRFDELEYGMIKISTGGLSLLVSPRGGATRALNPSFLTDGGNDG